MLGPNKLWVQTKFWSQKKLSIKKMFVQKNVGPEKMWVPKIGSQKMLCAKFQDHKINLVPWYEKLLGSKESSVQKNCCQRIFLQKMLIKIMITLYPDTGSLCTLKLRFTQYPVNQVTLVLLSLDHSVSNGHGSP